MLSVWPRSAAHKETPSCQKQAINGWTSRRIPILSSPWPARVAGSVQGRCAFALRDTARATFTPRERRLRMQSSSSNMVRTHGSRTMKADGRSMQTPTRTRIEQLLLGSRNQTPALPRNCGWTSNHTHTPGKHFHDNPDQWSEYTGANLYRRLATGKSHANLPVSAWAEK